MNSRTQRVWLGASITAILLLVGACSGGGGDNTTPLPGEAFSLLIIADPASGPSPLSVSFFVVPSGGVAPYTYAWDFNQDGVTDSNSSSGLFVYTASGKASVTVTDANGDVVSTSKTINITGVGSPGTPDQLDIRFNATPQVGNVPFNCQFTAFVSGGKEPYAYAWDFNGDGTFDSFLKDPLFTYEQVGQQISGNTYVFYPVLQVTDGRGIVGTNLDDNDSNGNPDFKLPINALPTQGGLVVAGSANPSSGQAPLTVEFTGSVSGGAGDIEYRWNFGDGQQSPFSVSSLASHTYVSSGTYLATVTARDVTTSQVVTSSPLTVEVSAQQTFALTISADITTGQVPFVVNFMANPVNGKEGINYQWDIFTDEPNDPAPSLTPNPTLDGAAVVTPDFTTRKNPRIHFANNASGGAQAFNYIARCVATDAVGNTAVSNLVRITAQPRQNPAGTGNNGYYFADRPLVQGVATFPIFFDPMATANPRVSTNGFPQPWGPRANAAVASHPTGVSFVFGGEILDANGQFERLVLRGDSAYAYIPPQAGTGSNQAAIGDWLAGDDWMSYQDGVIRLNDDFGPAFPGIPDSTPPPQRDPQEPPAMPPPAKTNRSAPFTIVGSAAAVFVHEVPETNDDGAYPGPGTGRDPMGDDLTVPESAVGNNWYGWPDSPTYGWNIDQPNSDPLEGDMAPDDGLGEPVIYVFGGRTDATTPTDLIQKYRVPAFGSEHLIAYSQDLSFQCTGNQTNIWCPYFLTPDTDQYVGTGRNFDPQIQDRTTSAGQVQQMPRLPVPLYGLMATRIETGVDTATPVFPNGPFHYIFVFGGIDATGNARNEMYWWDTSLGLDTGQEPGEKDGVFSEVADMPTPRAYGQAVFIPGNPMRIALIGGVDDNGNFLNTIDVFTFDNMFNPSTGTWDTFEGTLPEALRALGAGYNPTGAPNQAWIVALAGWTGSDFNYNMSTARLGSPGNLVVTEGLAVAPRSNMASSQSAMAVLNGGNPNVSFNRYYLIGGVDENGPENFVEVVSLP